MSRYERITLEAVGQVANLPHGYCYYDETNGGIDWMFRGLLCLFRAVRFILDVNCRAGA